MDNLPPNTRNRQQRTAAYREALDEALKAVDDQFRADIDRCRAEESALIAEMRAKNLDYDRQISEIMEKQHADQIIFSEKYRALHLQTLERESAKDLAEREAAEEINSQYPDVEQRRV